MTGLFGAKSSGKTTVLNTIAQDFIEQASHSTYDIENPFINNGPITHFFYLSPSIISDNTLHKQKINKNLDRQDIELNDKNIDLICAAIYEMRNDIH